MSKVIDLDKIIEKMNNKFSDNPLTEIEKARYLYIELGKLLKYDINYDTCFEEKEKEVYYKPMDVDNIQTNSYVCTQISEMYAELLKRAGINAKVEKEPFGKRPHKYTAIKFKDGRKILADLTLELSYIQKGLKTIYFGDYDKESYDKISDEELDKIDEKIGYKCKFYSGESEYADYFINMLKQELEDEEKLKEYMRTAYSQEECRDYKPEYLVRYKFDVISRFLKTANMGFREGDNFLRYICQNFFSREEMKQFDTYKMSNEIENNYSTKTEELRCYKLKVSEKGYEYYLYEEGQNLKKISKEELTKRLSIKRYEVNNGRRAESALEL